jgi:predicted aspartyl protease
MTTQTETCTSSQQTIRNGSREVIINEQNGHYWANLYVNNGETITGLRWTGKTLAGAKRWADRVLN